MKYPLKIIVADDHPLLLDGIKNVLNEYQEMEVTSVAANGNELISLLRKSPADIILLDLQMPRMDGPEAIKIIRKEFPILKIIVFTHYHQDRLVRLVKSLGASGYLLKSSSSGMLKEAILEVATGKHWFPDLPEEQKTTTLMTDDFIKKYDLTDRETEIIRKIAKGLTTKEIAAGLFLSEFTINTHRRNICKKLNVYTPVGLLNFAREHGLA